MTAARVLLTEILMVVCRVAHARYSICIERDCALLTPLHRQARNTCDQGVAVQERWLDPDCEYARPIDPSSTHVPMGPAGLSGAASEAKGMHKPVGPSVNANCTQDGMKGAMASDPYAFKGQRVRMQDMN